MTTITILLAALVNVGGIPADHMVEGLKSACAGHPRQKQGDQSFPVGSEKAVAAIRAAFPKSEIDEVAEPKGFGGSGGKGTPMLWNVRFHVGETKRDLAVTPEGVIVRVPETIAVADLPKEVADAVAKSAPGAKLVSATRNEVRATMKYVAFDKTVVQQYAVDVVKDGSARRHVVSPDGKSDKESDVPAEKKAVKPEKEFEIPAKGERAVAAIKKLHPDAVVAQITYEMFDDGTGDMEILTYEIEYVTNGVEHENVVSPEGVIPHIWITIDPKDLPKPVTEAVEKSAPGARIEKAKAFEIRASLRLGPAEKPKTFYSVQLQEDGKDRTIDIKPDGSLIKKAAFK
jgi:hypothetical protein